MFYPTTGSGWIGVGFDGGLSEYLHYGGPATLGPPVPGMVTRVRAWLAAGFEVRIVTSRVASTLPAGDVATARLAITGWSLSVFGVALPVTAEVDPGMIELWHPRAIGLHPNTGGVDTGTSHVDRRRADRPLGTLADFPLPPEDPRGG